MVFRNRLYLGLETEALVMTPLAPRRDSVPTAPEPCPGVVCRQSNRRIARRRVVLRAG